MFVCGGGISESVDRGQNVLLAKMAASAALIDALVLKQAGEDVALKTCSQVWPRPSRPSTLLMAVPCFSCLSLLRPSLFPIERSLPCSRSLRQARSLNPQCRKQWRAEQSLNLCDQANPDRVSCCAFAMNPAYPKGIRRVEATSRRWPLVP